MIKLKIPFSLKSLSKTRSIQLLQRTGWLQTRISVVGSRYETSTFMYCASYSIEVSNNLGGGGAICS